MKLGVFSYKHLFGVCNVNTEIGENGINDFRFVITNDKHIYYNIIDSFLFAMPNAKYDRGSILNESHSVALILFLDEREEVLATELLKISGNYVRMKLLVEKLNQIGLVNAVIEHEPRMTYKYSLTTKGKLVAIKLREIEDIMDD